jgi:WD40 repeat protein
MTVSSIEAVNVGAGRFFSAICVPKSGNILTMLMSERTDYGNGIVSDPQLVWYDLSTRKVTYRREGHTASVYSTVVLPNGTKVFSAGKDGKLIEYGPDLKFVRVLGRSSKPINRIAASPDSTMLAVAQADQYVRVFTIATGAQKFAYRGHAGQVTGVAFSPDGKLLASTGYDGFCRIYDTATGRQTRVFPKQRYGVTSVVWLSNTRLATGGWNEVKIWNLTTTSGTVAATLPDQFGYVLSLAVSKAKQTDLVTAKYLASGGWDGWVTCYDLGNANTKVLEQWAHNDQINSVAFTADDTRLLTASDDSLMGEWDHVNGLFVDYYVHNHNFPVSSLAVSPTTGIKYYSWGDGTLVSAF